MDPNNRNNGLERAERYVDEFYSFVDAPELVAGIELRGFPIEAEFRAKRSRHAIELTVQLRVRHRDTGERITIMVGGRVRPDAPPEQIRYMLHRLTRDAVLHEVDECWHENGVRVHDPHARDEERRMRALGA